MNDILCPSRDPRKGGGVSRCHLRIYTLMAPCSFTCTRVRKSTMIRLRRTPLLRRARWYSSIPTHARLNTPTDFETTLLLNHNSRSALASNELSFDAQNGTTTRLNLFQAINAALSHALRTDPRVLLFGEDVAFGGVFRCRYNQSIKRLQTPPDLITV